MICIGVIVKSHKTSGQFLCQLFSPVLPDDQEVHRLTGLTQLEVRPPGQRQAAERGLLLQLEEPQLVRQDRLGQTSTILLKSPAWVCPEQVKPFHAWELWADDSYASFCEEGEFLYCELIGAEVYVHTGQNTLYRCLLGYVSNLIEGGVWLLLEVQLGYPCDSQHKSLYVPFHSSIIGRVQREGTQKDRQLSIEILDLEYFKALF